MNAPRTPGSGRPPRGRVLPAPGKPPSQQMSVKSPSVPHTLAPPRAPAASQPRPRGFPPAASSASYDESSSSKPPHGPGSPRSITGPRGTLKRAFSPASGQLLSMGSSQRGLGASRASSTHTPSQRDYEPGQASASRVSSSPTAKSGAVSAATGYKDII